MLVKPNFSRERREKLYEREISLILYKISQENNLSFFSLSHCVLRGRGESLQIYLNSSRKEKNDELLQLVNKKYSLMIKKELVKGKKFPYIPNITILIDKETERIDILEEITRKIS